MNDASQYLSSSLSSAYCGLTITQSVLQTTAMVTGPAAPTSVGPFARGTVTAISPISPGSSLVLATVAWADGESSQVNMANLELQPGNPPL